jgi:hypothetical protein
LITATFRAVTPIWYICNQQTNTTFQLN